MFHFLFARMRGREMAWDGDKHKRGKQLSISDILEKTMVVVYIKCWINCLNVFSYIRHKTLRGEFLKQILRNLSQAKYPQFTVNGLRKTYYFLVFYYLFICLFWSFLGLHLWHMEVPRLRVQLELWPPAYATATATRDTATQDPSHICDLHCSSWQHWILNPLREAKDQTHVLMDSSWVHYHWATMRTPGVSF